MTPTSLKPVPESPQQGSAVAVSRERRPLIRRRVHSDRQDEILERLHDIVLTEGFADLTLDDMAARLQCSKSTLYSIASSREQLITRAIKRFFSDCTEHIEARINQEPDPRKRVGAYLECIGLEMARMSSACFDDMVGFDPTRDVYGLNSTIAARRVREMVQDGISKGIFRPLDAEFVAESVSLLIDGIMNGELLRRTGLSVERAYVELGKLMLSALVAVRP